MCILLAQFWPFLPENRGRLIMEAKGVAKMKNGLIALITILALTLLVPGMSYGETTDYTWDQKLIRGATNIITSPLEIPHDMYTETTDNGLFSGLTMGIFKGLGDGIVRLGAGAVDLLTFPVKYPDAANAPLVEPEFILTSYGVTFF